jgi:hypothetical protein
MKKTTTEPAQTILVICLGLIVVHLATHWRFALPIALVIGLLGAFSPTLAYWIDYLWMKLAWLLSLIVPNILLSAVFYLFLTPFALLSRIFGDRDPMRLKNTGSTMFKDSQKTFDKKSFENPW